MPELQDAGERASGKRIARLVRGAESRGRTPKRWDKTTGPGPAATGRVDHIRRDFTTSAAGINARWCGDITSGMP